MDATIQPRRTNDWMLSPVRTPRSSGGRRATAAELDQLWERLLNDPLELGREVCEDTTPGFLRADGRIVTQIEMAAAWRWANHQASLRRARDGCCGEWADAARYGGQCPLGQGLCRAAKPAVAIRRFVDRLNNFLGEQNGDAT